MNNGSLKNIYNLIKNLKCILNENNKLRKELKKDG